MAIYRDLLNLFDFIFFVPYLRFFFPAMSLRLPDNRTIDTGRINVSQSGILSIPVNLLLNHHLKQIALIMPKKKIKVTSEKSKVSIDSPSLMPGWRGSLPRNLSKIYNGQMSDFK